MEYSGSAVPEPVWHSLRDDVSGLPSLCAAAQVFAERLYADYPTFAALVRVFCTLPLGTLPAEERAFAERFLEGTAEKTQIGAGTPVLTLLGTRGIEPRWSERTHSHGHRAIPLPSNAFIGEIPMIARLLGETGFPALEGGGANWQFVRKVSDSDGLFFVGDARTTTDERGRRIIPATDFVERYGIKTVFGFGGPYENRATFLSVIVFCRRTLLRSDAAKFIPLMNEFRSATTRLEREGAVFPPA